MLSQIGVATFIQGRSIAIATVKNAVVNAKASAAANTASYSIVGAVPRRRNGE